MGLDLELVIVPPPIGFIRNKSETNLDYGSEIQFLPSVIRDQSRFSKYWKQYPHTKEFTDDVKKLKTYYSYADDDFFCEAGRESSTLDYLLDKLIENYALSLNKKILWCGGEPFAAYAAGGQAIPVRIYPQNTVQEISEFLSIASSNVLMKNYDFEKMSSEGVYKLTHPDNKAVISQSFEKIKSLFRRADEKDCLIVKIID